jgi:hypothetical protein
MEVSDRWYDRKPAIILIGYTFDLGAGQMEQPVKNKIRKSAEARDRKNNRSPGRTDHQPP